MNPHMFKVLREYVDLTQAELSLETGLSKALISDLETGRRFPSRNALDAYNRYFGLDDYQLATLGTALDSDGDLPKPSQFVLNVIKYVASKAQGRVDRSSIASDMKGVTHA